MIISVHLHRNVLCLCINTYQQFWWKKKIEIFEIGIQSTLNLSTLGSQAQNYLWISRTARIYSSIPCGYIYIYIAKGNCLECHHEIVKSFRSSFKMSLWNSGVVLDQVFLTMLFNIWNTPLNVFNSLLNLLNTLLNILNTLLNILNTLCMHDYIQLKLLDHI